MAHIDPEEIVSHYSRDDLDKINPREGRRTFKDAQQTMGRTDHRLPNLSDLDLEMNDVFQQELERQKAIIARIEKIRVFIDSQPGKDTELIMNRDLSTPFDCARHIHDMLASRSVVAEIRYENTNTESKADVVEPKNSDGIVTSEEQETALSKVREDRPLLWDMHRPISSDCRIKFRHFTDDDPSELNKIYWRSCSFVLGMAIRLAFKDDIKVLLHSWPKPSIKSGSFVYDVALNLKDKWQPSEQELRAFTKLMWNIRKQELPFERLQVDRPTAEKMFRYNPFKLSQIGSIVQNEDSNGKVTVYRCGGLLDISVGPMISNTNQIGRISLAAAHPFDSESETYKGLFYRFQGVSLPQQLPISSFLYQNVLLSQAKKLNMAAL